MSDDDNKRYYGWKRSLPDWRDRTFAVAPAVPLPSHVNLSSKCPPIWNQGRLGSCTAHGSLRAYVADRMRQKLPVFMPSRLLQYYDSRALEGTVLLDAGASTRDAIRSIATYGSCDEALWPYDPHKFAIRPPANAYTEAAKHKAIAYEVVPQDLYSIKAVLAQGYPVVFGFQVYQNFEADETTRTGLVYMPDGNDIGGHCVCAVGYNSNNYIMFANSWGTGWGDPQFPGHGWMPPEYITSRNLAADFWVIKAVQA